jgi:predicted site-specific integrase-resolvase
MIGASYLTLRQWTRKGKAQSIKTPGGYHRRVRSEVERLSSANQSAKYKKPDGPAPTD